MAEAAKEFLGTKRFSLSRKLGAGGMGVVYEAIDQLTKKTVALKTLTRAEPEHIYRLKRARADDYRRLPANRAVRR